jgi:hypothetical protein
MLRAHPQNTLSHRFTLKHVCAELEVGMEYKCRCRRCQQVHVSLCHPRWRIFDWKCNKSNWACLPLCSTLCEYT